AYISKERKLLRYRLLYMLMGTTILFMYLSWTTNLIKGRTFQETYITHWGTQTLNGSLYLFFLIWLESLLMYSLYLLVKDYKQTLNPLRKIQSRYIAIAIAIPLLVGTFT